MSWKPFLHRHSCFCTNRRWGTLHLLYLEVWKFSAVSAEETFCIFYKILGQERQGKSAGCWGVSRDVSRRFKWLIYTCEVGDQLVHAMSSHIMCSWFTLAGQSSWWSVSFEGSGCDAPMANCQTHRSWRSRWQHRFRVWFYQCEICNNDTTDIRPLEKQWFFKHLFYHSQSPRFSRLQSGISESQLTRGNTVESLDRGATLESWQLGSQRQRKTTAKTWMILRQGSRVKISDNLYNYWGLKPVGHCKTTRPQNEHVQVYYMKVVSCTCIDIMLLWIWSLFHAQSHITFAHAPQEEDDLGAALASMQLGEKSDYMWFLMIL